MMPILTQDYISLGQQYAVTFGNTPLTFKLACWMKVKRYPAQRDL